MKKLTVEEYVQALEKMKRSPKDRIGILGELGVTGLGVTAGFALSGSIAGVAGVATLSGSTTLASVLGGVFVTTTPIGWVIGASVAGGALAYAVGRLVHSGGKSDTLKKLNISELEVRIKQLRHAANSPMPNHKRMTKIITGIQHLVTNFHITQEKATELLAAIEKGQIKIDEAFDLIDGILNYSHLNQNRPTN